MCTFKLSVTNATLQWLYKVQCAFLAVLRYIFSQHNSVPVLINGRNPFPPFFTDTCVLFLNCALWILAEYQTYQQYLGFKVALVFRLDNESLRHACLDVRRHLPRPPKALVIFRVLANNIFYPALFLLFSFRVWGLLSFVCRAYKSNTYFLIWY